MASPLGLPRGNGFRILSTPMPSSRPAAGTRNRRMLVALAGMVIVCGTGEVAGDDSPRRKAEARVEINGGRRRDATVEIKRDRKRAVRVEVVSDSKDVRVEIKSDHRKGPRVEVV